jgi:hypothetical protein
MTYNALPVLPFHPFLYLPLDIHLMASKPYLKKLSTGSQGNCLGSRLALDIPFRACWHDTDVYVRDDCKLKVSSK